MKTRKLLVPVLYLSGVAILMNSCADPAACFTSSPRQDSIYVKQPVTFDGRCSDNTKEFFWLISQGSDTSIYYTPQATKAFKDTGMAIVYLLVVGGGSSDQVSQTIKVKP